MAKFISGKVKNKFVAKFHKPDEVEPFLGFPDQAEAVILSEADGTRTFYNFDPATIIVDSATNTIAVSLTEISDVFDSQFGTKSIGDLIDVDLTGIDSGRVLKWDGAKFVAGFDETVLDSLGSSAIGLDALSVDDDGGYGSLTYNDFSGVFTFIGTDSNEIKDLIDSSYIRGFSTTAINETVDSEYVRPLARAAITAGANINYDSSSGVISLGSFAPIGVDSTYTIPLIEEIVNDAYVEALIDSAEIQPLARAAMVAGDNILYDSATGVITSQPVTDSSIRSAMDSATIRPLARAAIVAGFNIEYDSGSGIISVPTASPTGVDSAATITVILETVDSSYVTNRVALATDTVKGKASFAANDFLVTDGAVSIKTDGVSNFQILNSKIEVTDNTTTADLDLGQTITLIGDSGVSVNVIDNGSGVTATITLDNTTQASIDSAISNLDTHDSAAVQAQIDSNLTQSTIDSFDTHDSAAIQAQIDSSLTQSLFDGFDTHDETATQAQIDSSIENNILGTANQITVTTSGGQATISLPNSVTIDSNLTINGYLAGPANFTIDPAGIGDNTGKVIIAGDLQVDGVQTTINSNTLSVGDKNIILADQAADSSEADNAGITVNGANAKITYTQLNDRWTFNKAPHFNSNRLLTDADSNYVEAVVSNQVTVPYINALANTGIFDSDLIPLQTDQINQLISILVDSNYISQFARTAVSGGANIIYDSGSGVISAVTNETEVKGFVDATYIKGIINNDYVSSLPDTHDSALVSQQIVDEVDFSFVTALADSNYVKTVTGIDADTLDGVDGAEFLRSNVRDAKTSGSLVFHDGVALRFGTDSDHTISENSGNLVISTTTGSFKVNTADFKVHNQSSTANMLRAEENGAVTLYNNNVIRLATTSSGVDITGNLDADSIRTTHLEILGQVHLIPTAQNASGSQVAVSSEPHNNSPCGIEYMIHMRDINGSTTKGETSFTKVICTLDSDLNTAFTEFGTLFTGDSEFGDFLVEADATDVKLKFTRRSTRDGIIRVSASKTVIT